MPRLNLTTIFTCIAWVCVGASGKTFPSSFRFGTATSAYQVEGAWDADGKGESIWDHVTHTFPEKVADGSNGDIACDSYNKYLTDVEMLGYLGVDYYRFSISWTRIMPKGLPNVVNQKGIDFYNNLIDALLAKGITPMITMYHWDLPQYLQNIGGWVNPRMDNIFRDYAKVLFDNFGDRVKTWTTFNEPTLICRHGYSGWLAPAIPSSGIADYQCSHNVLRAHAKAYRLYDEEYRATQQGKVGIVLESPFYFAPDNTKLNEEARERSLQFSLGFYAHPIFHSDGNYPRVMIDRIANRSYAEGFRRSRLPSFTPEEIRSLRGSADYLGLNHYWSEDAYYIDEPDIGEPSYISDLGTLTYSRPSMEAEGLRLLLNWIKDQYNDPEIIITENGLGDEGGTDDLNRKNYFQIYLNTILDALVQDNVKVTGYTAWSLMDNFEWMMGYTRHYGLYAVDFESSNRTRTIKLSGEYIKQVIATRCVSDDGCDDASAKLSSFL